MNTTTLTAANTTIPDFLKARSGNTADRQQLVDREDVGTPYLKLMQPLSPEVDEHDATVGTFFNTLTHISAAELLVSNLGFERSYMVTGDPAKGGSRDLFVGHFESQEAAQDTVDEHEDGDKLGIIIAHKHTLRIVATGEIVAISFANTALQVSKLWNTAIMQDADLPRSARFWRLTAQKRKNDKGFWFVPRFEAAGYVANEDDFTKLLELEKALRKDAA